MVPFKYSEFIDDLTYLVKNNIIPMDRIDDAVSRILLVKFSIGLFESPLADLSLVNELGSQVTNRTIVNCHNFEHTNWSLNLLVWIVSVVWLRRKK